MPGTWDLVCKYCGREYVAKRAPREGQPRVCKEPTCQKRRKADYQMDWERRYKAKHGNWSTRRYKEDPVKKGIRDGKRLQEMSARKRYPGNYSAKDTRRRMRLAGATVEVFDPMEVFERDGWVCQLCEKPVDQLLEHPDPMCKSLDHKTPISLGGDHSRENTQLTHLRCNIRKGANVAPDEPPRQTRNP